MNKLGKGEYLGRKKGGDNSRDSGWEVGKSGGCPGVGWAKGRTRRVTGGRKKKKKLF